MALQEHQHILMDSFATRDFLHKDFIHRCIEDIKKEQWVVPALRQMHVLLRNRTKGQPYRQYKNERIYLSELNRNHELVKLVVSSLSKCHQTNNCPNTDTMFDGRYTHFEV